MLRATRKGKFIKGKGTIRTTGSGPGRVTRPRAEITNGSASIVFFYYGDNFTQTLFQETLKLKKALQGYDRKVLLKHNETPSFLDFSEADERMADVMLPPTRQNLKEQIVELANDGYMIDLYIFAHGLNNSFTASTGQHGDTEFFTDDDIHDLRQMANLIKIPLRMVYQLPCYGQTLNSSWRTIGAKVTAGARGVIFYPPQFKNFIRDWNTGTKTFSRSVLDSETAAIRTLGQAYILGDALANRGSWGGCPFAKTVLGSNSCARDYFDWRWFDPGEWRANRSGKQNMNFSSKMFVDGQGSITKNTQPSW